MTHQSDTGPFALIPEWVERSGISDRAYRLYGVLARYADAEGKCWPARSTLAERLACSPTSVDRAKHELRDIGALVWRQRAGEDGDLTSNEYVVRRAYPAALARVPLATAGATPSRAGAADNETHTEREPSNDARLLLEQEGDRARESYEDEFSRAWEVYPRKAGRKAALKAWQARRREGVPAELLNQAVAIYAVTRAGQDQQFTMHGSTFLGPDERWRDYLAPPDEPAGEPVPAAAVDAAAVEQRAAGGPHAGSRPVQRAPWESDQ